MCCDVTSLYPNRSLKKKKKRQRHASIVYFLHADVCEGFHVVLCGELCFHMFANADVVMSIVYFCICVWARVCELALSSWISRESRQYTPYCNTSHCDTHSKVWYTECSPLPFYTSLFSFTEYFLLLLNTLFFCRRLHFIGTTLMRGCFSKGHKLVIIQSWKSLLDQWMLLPQSLSFILESSFSF